MPYDDTNKITCLYSDIIKEYNFIIKYPVQKDIILLTKSLIKSIKVDYNEEKDINYLIFINSYININLKRIIIFL
jgi:hypothetical protein